MEDWVTTQWVGQRSTFWLVLKWKGGVTASSVTRKEKREMVLEKLFLIFQGDWRGEKGQALVKKPKGGTFGVEPETRAQVSETPRGTKS